MAKKKIIACFCLHCHHDKLMEWCYDYDGRVKFIEVNKPHKETEKRLLWFRPVKGKLPVGLIRARERLDKADKASDKAYNAYCKTGTKYRETALDKTSKAADKAYTAYGKVLKNSQKAIEKLHAKECPDCTWNGKKLVF